MSVDNVPKSEGRNEIGRAARPGTCIRLLSAICLALALLTLLLASADSSDATVMVPPVPTTMSSGSSSSVPAKPFGARVSTLPAKLSKPLLVPSSFEG